MVCDYLQPGADNAISSRLLCSLLRIDARQLTREIEKERRAGKPICATSENGGRSGYYLAADKTEMQEYCERLRHRAGEIFKTRAACMKVIEELPEREPD